MLWPQGFAKAGEAWEQVGGMGLGDNNNTVIVTMETWDNSLFAGIGNYIDGNRIYRSTDGNTWTKVNNDGFGHAALNIIIDFEDFNNTLFASATDDNLAPAQTAEIWKSADGIAWVQSGGDGLGHADNTGFYQMTEFNGQLYVGSRNDTDGAEMYRSNNGTNWNLIANTAGGFGDVNNTIIWGLKALDGFIWAGTSNANGAQIWRSVDGTNWVKYFDYATTLPPMPQFVTVNNITTFNNFLYWFAISGTGAQIITRRTAGGELLIGSIPGMGDGNNSWFSQDIAINGSLVYFGTRNDVTGGELWYSSDGINAIQIGQDGFGNLDNYAIYALTFKDFLYIGLSSGNALKGCEIWRKYSTSSFGIKTKILTQGQQFNSYSTSLDSTGGAQPYSYSVVKGNLPNGLTLDPKTGQISGTPTNSGDFEFTIQVQDSGKKQQKAQRIYFLKIIAGVSDTNTNSMTVLPETGADF